MYRTLEKLWEPEIYNLTGCIPHCEHDEISMKSAGSLIKLNRTKDPSILLEFQFENGKYKSKEEYIVYDTDSFIADVGGYLGLLLGHSLLSIYSNLAEWFMGCKIWKLQLSACNVHARIPADLVKPNVIDISAIAAVRSLALPTL